MQKTKQPPVLDADAEWLVSRDADQVAQILDRNGWQIVPQPNYAEGHKWRMNRLSSVAPSWADPAAPAPKGDAPLQDRKAGIEWVRAALACERNLYHEYPDGTWSTRRRDRPH